MCMYVENTVVGTVTKMRFCDQNIISKNITKYVGTQTNLKQVSFKKNFVLLHPDTLASVSVRVS